MTGKTAKDGGSADGAPRNRELLLDLIATASQLRASLEACLDEAKPLDDEALTLAEAAKLLGRCKRTVVRWVHAGVLPARRVPRGCYLTWQFSRSEVMRFKEQRMG